PDCQVLVAGATRAAIQTTVEDLRGAEEALQQLSKVLKRPDRLGDNAPGLTSDNDNNLGTAIRGCLGVAEELLRSKGPAPAPAGQPEAPQEGGKEMATGTAPV